MAPRESPRRLNDSQARPIGQSPLARQPPHNVGFRAGDICNRAPDSSPQHDHGRRLTNGAGLRRAADVTNPVITTGGQPNR